MAKETTFSGSRNFSYFQPKGRHPSEYEDLTLHTQPDPRAFAFQGWFLRFANGREPWTEKSTALKSTSWWAFQDPSKQWQRTYVATQAEQERSVDRIIDAARAGGLFTDFDETWGETILGKYYAAYACLEYGLFRCFAYAQREALSATAGNVCIFNAADKIRHAQDIALYGIDLAEAIPGFSDAEAKQVWLNDPVYQGARKNVEGLMASQDWGEVIIGVNLVLEPLFGVLARVHFFSRFAPRNGDAVTPAILATVENDWQRNLKRTKEFVQVLLRDPEHSAGNKQVIEGWLANWLPYTREAAQEFAPLFDLPTVKPHTFAQAWERVEGQCSSLLEELGLQIPSPLAGEGQSEGA
jgi:methane monooxygenase component A beta chain/propane monooxygenase small subunit